MTLRDTPKEPSVEEIRAAHGDFEISGWLWEWLLRALSDYVVVGLRRLKASVYSPSGRWDPVGIRDLVHDFIIRQCSEKGLLQRALARTETTEELLAYLKQSLRNYTISEQGRSLSRNNFLRLVRAVEEDPELSPLAGAGSGAVYGLTDWFDDPPPRADGETLRHARTLLPEERLVEYHTNARRSPGLSTESLGRIAKALICGTERTWTPAQMMTLINERYGLEETPGAALDELIVDMTGTSGVGALETLVDTETAERFLESLSDRQQIVLRWWIGSGGQMTARDIEAQTGIKKSTVNNEQQAIRRLARSLGLHSMIEEERVLSIVAERLGPP